MADIYGRTPLAYGGGFRHDGAKLTITGGAAGNVAGGGGALDGLALIVQRFAVSYQKRLTKVFEFGQPNFYFVEGPPDGVFQIDNLIGPKGLVLTFAETLGDICKDRRSLQLAVAAGCGASGEQVGPNTVLTMTHALVDSFSLSGEAQTALLNSQVRVMYGSLQKG